MEVKLISANPPETWMLEGKGAENSSLGVTSSKGRKKIG